MAITRSVSKASVTRCPACDYLGHFITTSRSIHVYKVEDFQSCALLARRVAVSAPLALEGRK
jgi:hypothetical protein